MAQIINCESDLNLFINAKKSHIEIPTRVLPQQYVPSEDYLKQRQEVATRSILDNVDLDSDEEEGVVVAKVTPEEKSRKLIR